jgi:hypothetical protein
VKFTAAFEQCISATAAFKQLPVFRGAEPLKLSGYTSRIRLDHQLLEVRFLRKWPFVKRSWRRQQTAKIVPDAERAQKWQVAFLFASPDVSRHVPCRVVAMTDDGLLEVLHRSGQLQELYLYALSRFALSRPFPRDFLL